MEKLYVGTMYEETKTYLCTSSKYCM